MSFKSIVTQPQRRTWGHGRPEGGLRTRWPGPADEMRCPLDSAIRRQYRRRTTLCYFRPSEEAREFPRLGEAMTDADGMRCEADRCIHSKLTRTNPLRAGYVIFGLVAILVMTEVLISGASGQSGFPCQAFRMNANGTLKTIQPVAIQTPDGMVRIGAGQRLLLACSWA